MKKSKLINDNAEKDSKTLMNRVLEIIMGTGRIYPAGTLSCQIAIQR